MDFPDYYDALGVPVNASQREIEDGYARLTLAAAPRTLARHSGTQAVAPVEMRRVEEAYDVLRNPAKRHDYDVWYRSWRVDSTAKGPSDEGALPEARRHPCPRCHGSGRSRCLICRGRGDPGCAGCDGRGVNVCVACLGIGTMSPVLYREFHEQLERQAQQTDDALDVASGASPLRGATTASTVRIRRLGPIVVGVVLILLGFYAARDMRERTRGVDVARPSAVVTPAPDTPAAAPALPSASETPPVSSEPQRGHRQAGESQVRTDVPAPVVTPGAPIAPRRSEPAQAPNGQQPSALDEYVKGATVEAIELALTGWWSSLLNADLNSHMAHYGDLLERYFTKRNISWQAIYQDKQRFLVTYPVVVQHRIHNLRITAESADRAVATFDKVWDFRMADNRRFAGEERQRLKLRQYEGRWKIVSEEELQVYWVVRPE